MPTFESIVKSHRRRQITWTKDSIERIDGILQRTAMDLVAKLRDIAGTGTIEEKYVSSLLTSFGGILDNLATDYNQLMDIHLLGSAQVAAAREAAIAGQLFSAADLEAMTEGLQPEYTKSVFIQDVGEVQVTFGRVAEHALSIAYQRIYTDGLTLSDRVWKLDAEHRRAIEDKVVSAIASQQSARDLAKELHSYLIDPGLQNGRYNAMRLARTEINTAHREGHIQSCLDSSGQLKGYISAIGFRLSASHPKPDICDVWASQDADNLGSGNYLPENVPVDHPHGLCYTVTILKNHPDMQFVTKEPKPDDVPDSQFKAYGVPVPEAADRKPGQFQTIREAHKWGEREYPNVKWNLFGCHVDTINPTLQEFDRQAKRYPGAADKVRFFKSQNIGPHAYAGFGPIDNIGTSGPVGFIVNPVWYNDKDRLLNQMAEDVAAGWHPKGCDTIEATMAHEFGHLIDHHLQVKLGADAVRDWKRFNPAGPILSGYAGTHGKEEAFAEGFSAIHHGTDDMKQLGYAKALKKFIKGNV
ncbi:hypothetical protein LLG39_15845 [bacterium]|nr:hypothetical protein [bacterium]